MEAIEKELEAELAAIGHVAASYDVADDLDDDSDDTPGANPLSSIDGFDEFASSVQDANDVKDRAAAVLAKAETILLKTDQINDEHSSSRTFDAEESEVSSSETKEAHSSSSFSSSVGSDGVRDESDGCSSCSEPAAATAIDESSTSNGQSQPRVDDITAALISAPPSPPPMTESVLHSNEYDDELWAIEQEAIEAEIARQERFRRSQEIRETALAEAKKVTGAAITIQTMARRAIAWQRVKRMRRALQVEAHLISVLNQVSVRRAMSTMQLHSSELRREAFQTARTRLQLHHIDRQERYNASAIIMQRCFRRSIALRLVKRTLEVAVVLQRFVRCKQSHRNFCRFRTSAIVVQRYVRARIAEKEVVVRKIEGSATTIQRVARGFVSRREYRCARTSIVTLQRCYRGQRARRQLAAIQCSSFAFDEDDKMSIGSIDDLLGGIGELDDEPDDAFLRGRRPPRRRKDVAAASKPEYSNPETTLIATTQQRLQSTHPASGPPPSSYTTSANVKTLPSTNTTETTGGWGVRVARAFSERGQNMLPGTRRRRNNNRNRREGQSRWR